MYLKLESFNSRFVSNLEKVQVWSNLIFSEFYNCHFKSRFQTCENSSFKLRFKSVKPESQPGKISVTEPGKMSGSEPGKISGLEPGKISGLKLTNFCWFETGSYKPGKIPG